MPGKTLRVAIIGAGLTGSTHARAARLAGASVVAVSDPDAIRAGAVAASVGARVVAGEELLKGGVADAVHVCSPPDSHFDFCQRALNVGMHVLSEKPVTATSAELEQLYALAASKGAVLCPVHQFPFQRGVLRAVERVQSLGTLRHIAAEISTAGAAGGSEIHNEAVAFDILPHPLSLSQAFGAGPLSEVDWQVVSGHPGEFVVSGKSGDVLLSYAMSTRSRPTTNVLKVSGDQGTATMDLFHGYSYLEGGAVSRFRKFARPFSASTTSFAHALLNGVQRTIHRETSFPGLRELIRRFYDSVERRTPAPIPADDALDIARARDTIMARVRR